MSTFTPSVPVPDAATFMVPGGGLKYNLPNADGAVLKGLYVNMNANRPCCLLCGIRERQLDTNGEEVVSIFGTVDTKLLSCGACKNVNYCSSGCQKSDWKRHKKECAKMKDVYDRAKEVESTSIKPGFNIEYTVAMKQMQAVMAVTEYGSSELTLSPFPERMPHCLRGKGATSSYSPRGDDIVFRKIEDVHIGVQFLIHCGFFNNLEKAQELLPALLLSLTPPRLLCDLRFHGSNLNALEMAAREGNFAICEWLVTDERTKKHFIHTRHLDPESLGEATVAWSAYTNHVSLCRMLVANGCDPRRSNDLVFRSTPPLFMAAQAGALQAVQYLVDEVGININYVHPDMRGKCEGHIIWHCNESARVSPGTGVISPAAKQVLDWAISKGARWPV
jgi:hypothetical protein